MPMPKPLPKGISLKGSVLRNGTVIQVTPENLRARATNKVKPTPNPPHKKVALRNPKKALAERKRGLRQEGIRSLRFLKTQGINAVSISIAAGQRSHRVVVKTTFGKYVFEITRENIMGRQARIKPIKHGFFYSKKNQIRIKNALSLIEESKQY